MALQKRKPSDVRQAEICEAALRILAQSGARRFTVKVLAQEVGLTEGAIFRHFPSMEGVVEAIVAHVETILFEDFPSNDRLPLQRLETFFWNRVRAIQRHPEISKLLLGDGLAQSAWPQAARRLADFKRRSQEFVLECLKEAKETGDVTVNPDAGTVLVLGVILALGHRKAQMDASSRLEDLAQECWQTLIRSF